MKDLAQTPEFCQDYEKLKSVSLNPARHAAPNAYEHSEMVLQRVLELAEANRLTDDEKEILANLARVHDIGKITGDSSPTKSVELLPKYGEFGEDFVALVKYHDCNLSWYQSCQRGEPPSDKAWRKLARRASLRLLCLFMVADRVDCPGGWRANAPLVWFLDEIKQRELPGSELLLDDGPLVSAPVETGPELSAGIVFVRRREEESQALLIRVRRDTFEVPKGHVQQGESHGDAALRELREETGLVSDVELSSELDELTYSFENGGQEVTKIVRYFLATPLKGEPEFEEKPRRMKEIRWVNSQELATLPLVNEELRRIVGVGLKTA